MNSMRKKVPEHSARYRAILYGLWRLLVCHVGDIISESRKLSWEDLRRGFTVNFVMTLLNLAMLTYFIWGFDHIDRLYDSVVINLLPAYFSPVAFYQAVRQKPEARRFDWLFAGFVFFIFLAVLLSISDKYDFDELGINVVVVMTSAPWLSRVPGSGVRGRGSGERETTASSLAGKEESSRKEDNSGQGKDGPAGAIAQGGNGR